MEKVKFVCPVCGKEAECPKSKYHEDKCCSRTCANKHPKNCERRNNSKRAKPEDMVTLTCEHCGKEFMRTIGYVRNQEKRFGPIRFCSLECHNADQKEHRVLVECSGCGKEMYVPKFKLNNSEGIYCSKQCQLEHHTVEITCENCGKKVRTRKCRFDSGQKYCSSKCYHEARLKEYEVYSKLHNSLMKTKLYKLWRNSALERDSYKCTECGTTTNLHVHHKVHMITICRKYDYNRKAIMKSEEFNDISNGQTLCQVCHTKKHFGNKKMMDLYLSNAASGQETTEDLKLLERN